MEPAMIYVYLAAIGALAVVVALLSGRMRELPVSEPVLALGLGVLIGPAALGIVELPPEHRSTVLLEASRLLLAIALMAIALRYRFSEVRSRLRAVAVLVVVAMPAMAAITAALSWWLLGLPTALAVLLGAALCPTDPVLASPIVTGRSAERHLPARIRQILSVESGANDGLALALVILGLTLERGEPLSRVATEVLYEVGLAALLGLVLGLVVARAVQAAEAHDEVEESTQALFAIVFALFVLGVGRLLEIDAILAVFVAGLAYNAVVRSSERRPQASIDESFNRFLVLPIFTLLGVALPWAQWRELGWRVLAFAVAVLLLRRLPVLIALRRPVGLDRLDATFLGWFGPIGVSALLYLTHSEEQGVSDPALWAAGSLVVAASTLAHGISAAPLARRYARAAGRS